MAIYTTHGAFLNFVAERPLELGPGTRVAGDALPGPYFRLLALRLVHGVAGDARHFITRMTAVDATHVGWLIHVAREAGTVCRSRPQFCRIFDVVGGNTFGVLGAWAVAGLASLFFPSPSFVRF
jgi:hypothetical protein